MELHPVETITAGADSVIVAGVLEGLEPLTGSETAVATVDESQFSAAGFEGKSGEILVVPYESTKGLMLVGLGKEVSFDSLRSAAGSAIRRVKGEKAVILLASADIDGATRAVAEGTLLGGYVYTDYKTDDDRVRPAIVDLVGADPEELAVAIVACEATMLARDWVNTPAKDKEPQALSQRVAEAAAGTAISVDIWDESRIRAEKLGGVLGVAAGSKRPPRVVIMEYRPEGAELHLALVGKGIIFDSGGLSLKSSAFMEDMKDDMSGAATVLAATIGIAKLGIRVNVTTIAPLTDNAVGGDAIRPGDVLHPVDGPTVEVLNTDAEGRLILADGLGLAKRYEPDVTVDVATLTGAAAVALGQKMAAVFASEDDLAQEILEAASRADEAFWHLPLFGGYRKSLDSNIADLKNISGSRYGGAIVAALFLAEYAGDGPWAHLDIAGPARARETGGELVKGASGHGVRTLIEYAGSLAGQA